MAEFDIIDLIRDRCALAREDVRLGIGDDAALLAMPAGQLLAVSTDTLVEGVHFLPDTAPFDLGWKALAVNLSDLAAVGATPAWATLALTMARAERGWVAAFADGFAALAREFKLALVGGDTTSGPLSVTLTVHGFVPEGAALRRGGARIGDAVIVTGTLGDAAAGLSLLRQPDGGPQGAQDNAGDDSRPEPAPAQETARSALLMRLRRPAPRVAQGLLLRGRASACIDVSDGLVADLGHVCAASGAGAEIEAERLPASSALLQLFEADARRTFQLSGGDDYELCFTVPDAGEAAVLAALARSGCAATRIGRIIAEPGVRVRDAAGRRIAVARPGWEHFS
jgi:thiamine-monophosphate kinase